MDPAASLRRFFELANSGDIDGFVDVFAEDFVEHETMRGMPPGREGTMQLFKMMHAAFPDMKCGSPARTTASSWACRRPAGASASRRSTSSGSAQTVSPTNTGAC